MNDGVMLKRTASATEQANENTNANKTNVIKSTTSVFVPLIIVKLLLSALPATVALATINKKISADILYKV